MSDVETVATILYPASSKSRFSNPERDDNLAHFLGKGYALTLTTVTTLNTEWIQNSQTVNDLRLIVVDTLVRD